MGQRHTHPNGESADDPLWFKDAIIYEIPVRAFYDLDGDGIGDLSGLIAKLDYVRDLGATAIWLLPFYPSPQRDGGYDIADYRHVSPELGTIADFRRLLGEAHRRGLRVITELVLNHTSDRHPWFERARRSPPGSPHRDFYVWSDDPTRYGDARVIFQDYEQGNWTWDATARAYFWHRFYSHQPDLNFDNEAVRRAVLDVCDFWFDLGVDGMRLDAVPYLFEREGTPCENLPETHAFLRQLRTHVDHKFPNRMLLAEANQWPEDAAAYFGRGDECHMNFHFPLMPRMFLSVQLESSFPIVDILQQTPPIPTNCQWALFLRNHDELTLEMVTDEDRDFMYRAYAEDPQMRVNLGIRRRLAPLMRSRARVELMTSLLLSMPGTPVLYYGDEIGMGDNVYLGDRDGVRTPMQWSAERNGGFSAANPQRLYLPTIVDPEYHHGTINVEAQQANPDSLLWWTKHLIGLRRAHRVFGRGSLEILHPDNGRVLAFIRADEHERILVVANLSRSSQQAELDLSADVGREPHDLLGGSRFSRIEQGRYRLTLGPHGFYWLALDAPAETQDVERLPRWRATPSWEALLEGRGRARLERALSSWMPRRRWFRAKSRALERVQIRDVVPLGGARILLVEARYRDAPSEVYCVPIDVAVGDEAGSLAPSDAHAAIAELETPTGERALIFDATVSASFAHDLLGVFLERGVLKGSEGTARGRSTRALAELVGADLSARTGRERRRTELPPQLGRAEQSNTSLAFGGRLIAKLYRVVEEGAHPEEELGRHLSERARFPHVPRFAGGLSYTTKRGGPRALAVLQELVPNQGDAWTATLDAVERYFDGVLERAISSRGVVPGGFASHAGSRQGELDAAQRESPRSAGQERLEATRDGAQLDPMVVPRGEEHAVLARTQREVPASLREPIGPYLGLARVLGERTAELHLALAEDLDDDAFRPEPFSLLHQRALYQSARGVLVPTLQALGRALDRLPGETRDLAEELLARRDELDARLRLIHGRKLEATRIRTHGDFHLGQILVAAGDFVFIDFEGEPARTLAERRRKRSPLRDVAGLLRSLDYASEAALRSGRQRPEDVESLRPWARAWSSWVGAAYLASWLHASEGASYLPRDRDQLELLLDFHLLEKAVYELRYELDHRPLWLGIPLRGLLAQLNTNVISHDITRVVLGDIASTRGGSTP
jgi:maltose alpha-D-glucosyltransferase/alpha-amylase